MKYFKYIFFAFICSFIIKQTYSQDINTSLSKSDTISLTPKKIRITKQSLIPDHNKIQYAGGIGYISAGLGYNFGKVYEITFMLGLQNDFLGDSKEPIITTSIKNNFNLFHPYIISKKICIIPTAGLSINWGFTYNSFDTLPSHYYFQNRINLSPFIGLKLRYHLNNQKYYKKAVELYFELGTIDEYIKDYIDTDYVTMLDILNLAIGVSIYFE